MRTTARSLSWLLLTVVLVAAACSVLGLWLLGSVAHSGFSLSINGEPVTMPDLQGWHWTAASAGGLLLAFLLVLAVPLVLALALTLAGIGVFVMLAALLLAVALALLVGLSPLWLVVLVLWWLLRRKTVPAATLRP
jgi:hypothetical protein